MDPYKWRFFEAIGILKEISDLDHSKYMLCWYKNDENKCNRMVNDKDVNYIYKYSIEMKCVVHLYVDHYVKDIVGINVEEDEQGNIINDEEDEQGDRINVEEAKQGDGINVEQDEQGNGGVNVEEYEQCDGRIIVEDGEQGGVNGKNVW
ncbi:unnamed protein product [Lathyrus oleraceus]